MFDFMIKNVFLIVLLKGKGGVIIFVNVWMFFVFIGIGLVMIVGEFGLCGFNILYVYNCVIELNIIVYGCLVINFIIENCVKFVENIMI